MEVKKFINKLLEQVVIREASDLFFLPNIDSYDLKIRTSQGIFLLDKIPSKYGQELINYLKFVAQMDIAEHRRPQVGSLNKIINSEQVFLRLSSVGDFNDLESLVIRFIYSLQKNNYFFPDQLEKLKILANKRGLILTSGPTGSGKTSTMYELAHLVGKDKTVMTIEDPVEIYDSQFIQTQVNMTANVSYIDLLKAALRHRPDILIIGEIRDSETANIAVNAALSGHLVLATIHARSTLQTISRLEGLGIKKYDLFNSLTGVSYQRLLPINKANKNASLIDIVDGNTLAGAIKEDYRKDFINWKENMTTLLKREQISAKTYELFYQG